jgi:DNA-binding CsgD family transcriptional regulator
MNSAVEIARGWDLFQLGAFAEAESMLAPNTREPDALRLQLWIAIRRGDIERKQHYGSLLAQCGDENIAAVGRAHENVALASLDTPLQPWLPSRSKWAQAEIAYARALIAFTNGQREFVRQELSAAMPVNPEQRVRYAALRAWEPAISDEFIRQAVGLLRCLTIALDGRVDRTLIASIASGLAFLVREVELGDLAARADELLARVEWPVDNTTYQYYGQWAMAWRQATLGEWIPAMNLLNGTLFLAPNVFSKSLIYADRARISRALKEPVSAASSCAFAYECLSTVNWSEAQNGESLIALSMVDVLASDVDRALDVFNQALGSRTSRLLGDTHGHRYDAFKSFARSHLTTGDASLRYAQEAYNLFKGMKYVHRASDCAFRAVQVGGGARWRKRVERLLEPYPRSLAACEYEKTLSPLNRIRGRRRELMDLLATSTASARDVGRSIGMGKETVRDHVKAINKILGIETRLQLVRMYLGTNPDALGSQEHDGKQDMEHLDADEYAIGEISGL